VRRGLVDAFDSADSVLVGMYESKAGAGEGLESREHDDDKRVKGE
jgi:hypothetical protein